MAEAPTAAAAAAAAAPETAATASAPPALAAKGAGGEIDAATRETVQKLPLLRSRAGPRDAGWNDRLKEELSALIQYVRNNKAADQDWFTIKSNEAGTKWEGTCWYYHERVKYEFEFCFEIPVAYPSSPAEIKIPELEGKTIKMYHGGKICLTVHFEPLWARNAPRFGIAHALALGLAPWLAAEVPDLVQRGVVLPRSA